MKKVLFVGPMPPSIGGVASLMANLRQGYSKSSKEVIFLDSHVPYSGWRYLVARRITLHFLLVWQCIRLKRGTVVFFSGGFGSFIEKCFWAGLTRLCGARPVIVMVSGWFPIFMERLSPFGRHLAALAIRIVDTLGVQSSDWCAYFDGVFPAVSKAVLNVGIDVEFFSPASQRKRAESAIQILYVGWIVEAKGINDLLAAVALLKQRTKKSLSVRMLGPAFGKEVEVRARIRNAGLEGIVEYGGQMSRQELLPEYRAADIFVFPSHHEGFPMALLEALSCGIACVATDISGCRDILANGNAGLLVDPHDPLGLAEALELLVTDTDLRSRLGRAARLRATSEYKLERLVESYNSLINRPQLSRNIPDVILGPHGNSCDGT